MRAALEKVWYHTRDLLGAMVEDATGEVADVGRDRHTPDVAELRVDGGMVVNDWLVQCLSDIVRVPVVRPQVVETTALGAAFLAGLQAGVYASLDEIGRLWRADSRFAPLMAAEQADTLYAGWRDAVARVRSTPAS